MSLNKNGLAFVTACESIFGDEAIVNRDDIAKVCQETDAPYPYWLVTKSQYRYGRGQYKVPPSGQKIVKKTEKIVKNSEPEAEMAYAQVLEFRQPKLIDESDSSVPAKYEDYVPFGFYKDLFNIVKSKAFYPVFITGLSGNGKTLMVEQVCAELNRDCIRVNISIETDETDLLGGPTLVNGNVVNRDGPVLQEIGRAHV